MYTDKRDKKFRERKDNNMQYKEFLEVVAKGNITEEVTEEAKRLLDVHEEKAKRNREKRNLKNEPIQEEVLELLKGQEPLGTKELRELYGKEKITSQKLSGILTQLVKKEEIQRIDMGSNKPYLYKLK